MEKKLKKDFITFTAFLMSRGIPVAGEVLKNQVKSDVLFSYEDIDYIIEVVNDEGRFRECSEHFMNYLLYLLDTEQDPDSLTNLKALKNVLTETKEVGFKFSLN